MAEAFVYPLLSTEQKLSVRELNFQMVKAKENAANLVKTAETNLMNSIQKLANDLGLQEIPSVFDIDTLEFRGK